MSLGWKQSFRNFETYLRLEKSLSENSIEAYLSDVSKLENFFNLTESDVTPAKVSYNDLKSFLEWYSTDNKNARTQSRVLSGIRAFFRFLLIEGEIDENPAYRNDVPGNTT